MRSKDVKSYLSSFLHLVWKTESRKTELIYMPQSYRRRRRWHPPPVLLPGKSHGQRSLVGCSPRGHEESDTTERLHFHFHALEKEMATHSSVLAWSIPGMAEPGGLLSLGLHRVRHDWRDLAAAAAAAAAASIQMSFLTDLPWLGFLFSLA